MKPTTNRRLRQVHHYISVFFAPLIVFFAFSGAVQTFRLNQAPGAPPWLSWIASVHKDQATPHPRPPRAVGDRARPPRPATAGPRHDPFALKVVVGIMSLALIASTLLGVAIGLSIRSMRRISIVLLILGALLPLSLLYI